MNELKKGKLAAKTWIAGPVVSLGGTGSQRTIDGYTPVIHHSFI